MEKPKGIETRKKLVRLEKKFEPSVEAEGTSESLHGIKPPLPVSTFYSKENFA